jgi:competence protein ComEC
MVSGILIHSIALAIAVAILAGAFSFFIKTKSGIIPLFVYFCIGGLVLGSVRMMFLHVPTLPVSSFKEVSGFISEYPDLRGDVVRYTVSASCFDGTCFPKASRILVESQVYPLYSYGDVVRVSGKPHIVSRSSDTYDAYLQSLDISASMQFAKVYKEGDGKGNVVTRKLFALRDVFSHTIADALPEPESGLLKGMLLGEKHALGKKLEDDFKRAGLSHIVVLSGYNLMLVFALFFSCSKFITLRFAPVLSFVGVALFVVLSGGEPAALRAAGMIALISLALFLRHSKSASHSLALTVIGFSLWDPLVASSVSFMLSALATYGMVEWEPIITPFLNKKLPWLGRISDVVSETLSAQIIVSPLILYIAGTISPFSIMSNILVIPLIPCAMVLGLIASLFSFLVTPLSLVSLPALIVLKYIVYVAHLFAQLPLIPIPVTAFIVWALSIFFVFYPLYRKKETPHA